MFRSPARATLILGLAVYVVLAILAIIFTGAHRIYYIAFHAVTILKKKTLFIQNQRFVALFSQIFPLAAQGLHFSLKGGTDGLFSRIYNLLRGDFRGLYRLAYGPGLVMLLLSTLLVTDTFYWVQSELPQGLALLVFTFALLLVWAHPGWTERLAIGFVVWIVVHGGFCPSHVVVPDFIFTIVFCRKKCRNGSHSSKIIDRFGGLCGHYFIDKKQGFWSGGIRCQCNGSGE